MATQVTLNSGSVDSAGSLALKTNGTTTAVTIDTSQNVGIGTSSPLEKIDVRNAHSSFGARGENSNVYITSGLDGSNYFETRLRTDYNSVFSIATGSVPAANAPSTGSLTERARIDSSGNLLVGTTSTLISGSVIQTVGSFGAYFRANGGAGNEPLNLHNTATSGTIYQITFRDGASATSRGSVTTNASSTSYNTNSDYRLKEDIQPMTGALAKVAALRPVTYKWKESHSNGEGFIAHELQAVIPDCVTGEKDAVDAEGNPVYQGIDTSFLVATLTAAIQEQQAIIVEMKAELDALKIKVGA